MQDMCEHALWVVLILLDVVLITTTKESKWNQLKLVKYYERDAKQDLRDIQNQQKWKIHYKLLINVNRHTSCRPVQISRSPPKKHFSTNRTGHTTSVHCTTNIWDIELILKPPRDLEVWSSTILMQGSLNFSYDYLRQCRAVSLLKRLLSILRKLPNFL